MAVGGHKGSNGGASSGRGRPYAVMLLLAFGAALMGVMVVHKLRERRIFNLLVKEKDRELHSLQLLFQKEREHSKEMKKKAEETKVKVYSLRTQKMELERRQLEMQSTIDSLKDEQKTLELALEEKQIEIKMMREKTTNDSEKEDHNNAQVTALMETLKNKESEIESLRHRLELPARVWSVSTADSTKGLVNLTSSGSMNQREDDGKVSESQDGASSENTQKTTDLLRDEKRDEEVAEEKDGVKLNKSKIVLENSTNSNVSEGSLLTGNLDSQGQVKSENVSEVVTGRGKQEQEATKTEEPRKLEDLHGGENKEVQASTESGMRLETVDNNGSRKEKHSHLSRKSRKWRTIARNRLLKRLKGMDSAADEKSLQHDSQDEGTKQQEEITHRNNNERMEEKQEIGADSTSNLEHGKEGNKEETQDLAK